MLITEIIFLAATLASVYCIQILYGACKIDIPSSIGTSPMDQEPSHYFPVCHGIAKPGYSSILENLDKESTDLTLTQRLR